MNGSRRQRGAAVVVMVATTVVWPFMPIVAKNMVKADDTYYKATVPTKDLDPAARDVIRRFSKWPSSYPSARRALLRLGWQPDPRVKCLSGQDMGDDAQAQKTCHDDPGDENCTMCRIMPEISNCSQGPIEHCNAYFIHPGSKVALKITTGGDMQGFAETNTGLDGFTFIDESSPDR